MVGFAIMFDIDGVLLKGATPIPEAKEALDLLHRKSNGDSEREMSSVPGGEFICPVMCITNGGFCTEQSRAEKLNKLLNTHVRTPSFTFNRGIL